MSILSDFLFPPACISCGEMLGRKAKRNTALCPKCRAEWEREKLRRCRYCGEAIMDCLCADVRIYRADCTELIKLCHYRDDEQKTVKSLIFCLKRDAIGRCERFLAEQLAFSVRNYLKKSDETDFIVTSVPRRKESVTEYGYDHAEYLARYAAEKVGLEYVSLICRSRDGDEQKYLSAAERKENARSAFSPSRDAGKARGKRIILADDIVTTGASMTSCADVLLSAGAEKVVCACIALTEKS